MLAHFSTYYIISAAVGASVLAHFSTYYTISDAFDASVLAHFATYYTISDAFDLLCWLIFQHITLYQMLLII